MEHPPNLDRMVTMNVSLPETLRAFVHSRLSEGFGSVSEYVRDLIRRDRELLKTSRVEQALAKSLVGEAVDPILVREALDGIRSLRRRVADSGGSMNLDEIRRAIDDGSGL